MPPVPDDSAKTGPAEAPAEPLALLIDADHTVSALLMRPATPRAVYVFAHGAGAGMHHAFMQGLSLHLAARGIATLRFQFPFMERGGRRTDPPALAQAAVGAAVQEAARLLPDVPLFAGGKSFGGRMSSEAQAAGRLPGVQGLAFVGFPLHPAGRPDTRRADHLRGVSVPMLFLQGTRDELAALDRLGPVLQALGDRVTLHIVNDADHSFHVRRSSGRDDVAVLEELADTLAGWFLR